MEMFYHTRGASSQPRAGPRSVRAGAVGARLELLVLEGAPQLVEGACLDLAHALARDAEMEPGLGEGAGDAVVETVADAQDLFFTLAQRAQLPVDLLVLELDLDQALDRGGRLAEILGRELLEGLEPRPLVERAQAEDQAREPFRARHRDLELGGGFLERWFAAQPHAQRAFRAAEAVHLLEHLHRDAQRFRLLGDAAQDRLADPDRRIRAEPQAALGLEAIRGLDQPE